MPRYASREWVKEADAALAESGADAAGRAALPGDAALVVQQVVTGGPEGDTAYHVVLSGDDVGVREGQAPDPTITFEEDYATAAAIARGDLSAQGAFMAGRIRVRGDLARLVEYQEALQNIDDLFGALRERTEY